jgi:hypothetical protein
MAVTIGGNYRTSYSLAATASIPAGGHIRPHPNVTDFESAF